MKRPHSGENPDIPSPPSPSKRPKVGEPPVGGTFAWQGFTEDHKPWTSEYSEAMYAYLNVFLAGKGTYRPSDDAIEILRKLTRSGEAPPPR